MSVTPIVEIWGFSKTLRRLGEALCIAAECGDQKAAILPDVYHLYKGGSDFDGLLLLSARAVGIFHVNDTRRSIATRSPTPIASTPATAPRR